MTSIEGLNWSDSDEDEKLPTEGIRKPPLYRKKQESQQIEIAYYNNQNIVESVKASRRQKQKIFEGSLSFSKDSLSGSPERQLTPVRIPPLPIHIQKNLGDNVIEELWKAFLNVGTDKSGNIDVDLLSEVEKFMDRRDIVLPFHKLKHKLADGSDYISFREVASSLAQLTKNSTGDRYIEPQFPPCCALRSCAKHTRLPVLSYTEHHDRKNVREENFQLYIEYNKYLLESSGRMRIRNIDKVLKLTSIPFDMSRLDPKYLKLRGEFLIESYQHFESLVDMVRTDHHDRLSMDQQGLYSVPLWLTEQLSASEILLYQHHFSLIDTDKSGAIDAIEFVQLVKSLGGKMTIEQAKSLINDFDYDFNGTMEFSEFATLMFKIQRNAVYVEDSNLLDAMNGFKSQLKLFDDIEELKRDPHEHVRIHTYGGNPMTLDAILRGPADSPYQGGSFHVRVTFKDGYPYLRPEILFLTKIFAVNIVSQLTGGCSLYHFKHIWKKTWTLKKLFEHILQILKEPDFTLLPEEMNAIVNLTIAKRESEVKNHINEGGNKFDEKNVFQVFENMLDQGNDDDDDEINLDVLDEVRTSRNNSARFDAKVEDEINARFDMVAASPTHGNGLALAMPKDDDWSDSDDENIESLAITKLKSSGPSPVPSLRLDDKSEKDGNKGIDSIHMSDNISDGSSMTKKSQAKTADSRRQSEHSSSKKMSSNRGNEGQTDERKGDREPAAAGRNDADDDKAAPSTIGLDYIDSQIIYLMSSLTRVEQMHLNVMYMYLTDQQRFNDTVKYYMNTFRVSKTLPGVEDEFNEEVIPEKDDESSMNSSKYDYGNRMMSPKGGQVTTLLPELEFDDRSSIQDDESFGSALPPLDTYMSRSALTSRSRASILSSNTRSSKT